MADQVSEGRRRSVASHENVRIATISEKAPDDSVQIELATIPEKTLVVESDGKVHLKRKMGLISGTAMIVGTMIGAGIFISPKIILERSGSVATALIIWFVSGFLSLLGALCYIELGALVPKSGADYAYLLEAYGPMHRFIGPLPAFLYSYTRVFVTGPSGFAAISLSFGTYAVRPFYTSASVVIPTDSSLPSNVTEIIAAVPEGPPEWLPRLVAAACVVIIVGINCFSVKLATRTQTFFAAIKVSALLTIVIAGLVKLGQGNTQNLATGFTPFVKEVTAAGIANALYSGLWSYEGWKQLSMSIEELKNPYRTLPRAIIIGLPLVMFLYILANIAYLTVMTTAEILAEPAVAVTFGERVLGVMAWVIPLAVVCSTFGAANGSAFGNSRLAFVTARNGHLVEFLSFVSVRWTTPLPAVLSQGFVALIMIGVGNISGLIDIFSFTAWIFYALTFASLLVMRKTKRTAARSYMVPIVIPVFMTVAAVGIVFIPIILRPQWDYLYAGLFIMSGLIFYVPLVYYEKSPRWMAKVNDIIQRLLGLAPSKLDPELAAATAAVSVTVVHDNKP